MKQKWWTIQSKTEKKYKFVTKYHFYKENISQIQ